MTPAPVLKPMGISNDAGSSTLKSMPLSRTIWINSCVVSTQSISGLPFTAISGRLASNFLAVQGMMDTTTISRRSLPVSRVSTSLQAAPNICWGDLQLDRWESISGKYCSANLTQAGQQEVNCGRFSPFCRRSRNSRPSSITVISAPKEVSYTRSKPIRRSEATICPLVVSPGWKPNASPTATRTAGAMDATTSLVLSCSASQTASICDFGVSAPTGQTFTHCPQLTHSTVPSPLSKQGTTRAFAPRWAKSSAPTD